MRLYTLPLLLAALPVAAQQPWRFTAHSALPAISLSIDLREESVVVPTMEDFGPMNGYLMGSGLYGIWMVTSVQKLTDEQADIHLSNDFGSETLHARLRLQGDTLLVLQQRGGADLKRAEGRRLEKLPSTLSFRIKTANK